MKKINNTASDIKVGVIGYGGAFNMGLHHLLQMKGAGMTPIAVAEVDQERLAIASKDFPGIEIYPDVTAMLKRSDVDLIVIITPHDTHAKIALQCIRAGKHVVSEKPLAITTREVDAMISAAKKAGVMLSTYHNRHWDGRILQAVNLVKEQKIIGDVIRIEAHIGGYSQPLDWWRSSRSISGGILYDWGVHLLEYSFQLIDEPMVEVCGFTHEGYWAPKIKWKNDANEDESCAIVRFRGGQWLSLTVTSIDSKGKEGLIEITGTKGTLVIDGNHSKLYQHIDGQVITTQFPNPKDQGERYYENVREHLLDEKPLVISAEWSRRPIHVLDLAAQSAKKKRTLPVKYS